MSILNSQSEFNIRKGTESKNGDPQLNGAKYLESLKEPEGYEPSEEEMAIRQRIIFDFTLSDIIMNKPRPEFNDMSVIQRQQYDSLAFNTYQSNNGEPAEGDIMNSWKSHAIRPVVRNKCISICAHSTARLIFPKVFAQDESSDDQNEAASVMEDLMEWAGDKSNYTYNSLCRTLTALYEPASIGYSEHAEIYHRVKTEKVDGKWKSKLEIDEEMSGFHHQTVPVNELYIENIYEPDIQKQGYLIWRKVISYSLAAAKYSAVYPNFKYVTPGVQLVYNDANQAFYQVYDNNMRQEQVEEITYWNKSDDLKIIMVNGVVLTDPDNPNPRNDKLYPFDKFGYELISPKFFYYKSLAFKMMQDANIINTLYPLIVDGTYLNMMPPMINIGGTRITSDVIIPGAVTTLPDPNADLKPLTLATRGLQEGMNTLQKMEESINETSQEPVMNGQASSGNQTAYEISRLEQNANTVLGLFVTMIGQHVRDYGRLLIGDILQFLTIGELNDVEDNPELVYKTFLLRDKNVEGKQVSRKLRFEGNMPENITKDQKLMESYKTLEEQDKYDGKVQICRINPGVFRNLKYRCTLSPDVVNPKSEELERALDLELYDRAIRNPKINQDAITRDLLLGGYPKTRKNVDKYMIDPDSGDPLSAMQSQNQQAQPAGGSPMNNNNQTAPAGASPAPATALPTGAPAAKV